jgi:hypothetical protein
LDRSIMSDVALSALCAGGVAQEQQPPATVRNLNPCTPLQRHASSRKPSAPCRRDAEAAFDAFLGAYRLKYEKAAAGLAGDREALLSFYDFPAQHWKHLRTSNPIESTFATVRHRTIRAKGCLSNTTALAMVFKLIEAAQKSWRRLNGHNQLPKVVLGVRSLQGTETFKIWPGTILARQGTLCSALHCSLIRLLQQRG